MTAVPGAGATVVLPRPSSLSYPGAGRWLWMLRPEAQGSSRGQSPLASSWGGCWSAHPSEVYLGPRPSATPRRRIESPSGRTRQPFTLPQPLPTTVAPPR